MRAPSSVQAKVAAMTPEQVQASKEAFAAKLDTSVDQEKMAAMMALRAKAEETRKAKHAAIAALRGES